MPLHIHIDQPDDLEIRQPHCKIRGWWAADSAELPRALEFRIGGGRLLFVRTERPDVESAHPDKYVSGFLLDLDLSDHLSAVREAEIVLRVLSGGEPESQVRFRISPEAMGRCLAAASGT